MLKRNTNITFKLLLLIMLIILCIFIIRSANKMETINNVQLKMYEQRVSSQILNEQPVLYPHITYAVFYDIETTEEYLLKVSTAVDYLSSINFNKYTANTACQISQEIDRLKSIESRVSADLSRYTQWESEHYYAAHVWMFFKQRGYNDAVTSAIIGNMMVETSGGSLDINPNIYSQSGNYYGLCQWSQKYYPGTKDLPFEYQLDYLLGSMPWEFNTFGNNYRQGFKYEDFINMVDVEEAALAFAKSYERCGPASYELRQQSAKIAYEYFKLD